MVAAPTAACVRKRGGGLTVMAAGSARLSRPVWCGTMVLAGLMMTACRRPDRPVRRPATAAAPSPAAASGAAMDADLKTTRSTAAAWPQQSAVGDLLAAARDGCPTSLGQVFEALRAQLLAVADEELPEALRAKVGPSDLVQETAMDMQRNFERFRGSTAEECFAWLRSILRNNVIDAVRHFEATQKRDVGLEFSLTAGPLPDGSGLPVCRRLPDGSAIRHEDAALVNRVVARLPADQSRVIELRYWRGMSFAAIGADLGRSEDAVRKLWYRAVERMQVELAAARDTPAQPSSPATTHPS